MLTPLDKAKNLGPVSQRELREIGVRSLDELYGEGWIEVFHLWCDRFPSRVNLNAARSLVGAARGLLWNEIDAADLERCKQLIAERRSQSTRTERS